MKNKNGFTLIELLCVIAVVGILSIIVAPSIINNLNNSKKQAMIIQENEIMDASKPMLEDYCFNAIDSSYKQECKTLFKEANSSQRVKKTSSGKKYIEKYICIEDLNKKGYYQSQLEFNNEKCSGIVLYQLEEETNKTISAKTYIVCGTLYSTKEVDKIDLNDYPDCENVTYPTQYYYLKYNGYNESDKKTVCLYDKVGSNGVKSGCKKESEYTIENGMYSRKGFLFQTWNTQIDGNGKTINVGERLSVAIPDKRKNNEEINIYATWTDHVYKIHYVLNNGTPAETLPEIATYDSIIKISSLSKTGYNFKGWSATSGLNTTIAKYGVTIDSVNTSYPANTPINAEYFMNLTSSTIANKKEVTLTAVFEALKPTVTLNPNGGTVSNTSMVVAYDSPYGTIPTPIKEGYTFTGWYQNNSLIESSKVTSTTKVTNYNNHTLYAGWKENVVTVNYLVNGGTINSNGYTAVDSVVYKNETIFNTKLAYTEVMSSNGLENSDNSSYMNIIKTGYHPKTESEWCTTANGSGTCFNDSKAYTAVELCSSVKTGDCTLNLYVNWEQTIYTVVYNKNGATSGTMSNSTIAYGSGAKLTLNTYAKTDNNFLGWSTSASATTATYTNNQVFDTYTQVHGSVVNLYAIWEENMITYATVSAYCAGGGTKGTAPYTISYTGKCAVLNIGGNWGVKFYTDGTLTINKKIKADAFLVGGGAGGTGATRDWCCYGGKGGAGGGKSTYYGLNLGIGSSYYIHIGAGGSGYYSGAATTAFGGSAGGGAPGGSGAGGGTVMCGLVNSASHGAGASSGTYAFGNSRIDGIAYGAGGGGGSCSNSQYVYCSNHYVYPGGAGATGGGGICGNATANTGSGGGGGSTDWGNCGPGAGASGIVIIRNVY